MNYDLLLGIVTAGLAALGGIVSAHAPTTKKHKIRYGVAFTVVGVLSIVLIVAQSRGTALARTESQRESMQLRARLDSSLSSQEHMQAQLDGIYLLVAKFNASSTKKRQLASSVQGLISHSLKQRSLLLANKIDFYIREHPLKVGTHMYDPFWRFQRHTPEEEAEVRAIDQDFADKKASLLEEFGADIETMITEFNALGLDTGGLRTARDQNMLGVSFALRSLATQIDNQGLLIR